MKISRTSVNKWIRIYLNEGLGGLQEKPRSGRPAYLTEAQMEQLSQYIKKNAIKPSGGRLTGADIHHHIKQQFGKDYHPDHVYTVLKRLNFSWITSRSKHPKQSQEAQDEFKKTTN